MEAPVDLGSGSLVAGDYRIVRQLSSGGMAMVYLAEQLSTGKQRALKILHRELVGDSGLRERFEREARVASLIESDHVVQIIGAGIDGATNNPWIAMELLEGEEVESFISRRGSVGPGELLELFRQLCHALGAAHSVGVVHRDLKPENMFLTATQSTEVTTRLKVLDFGISKVLSDVAQPTETLGTPIWMAPEQSDPKAVIRPATDVWSLGLLAFWMLTGKIYWSCVHLQDVSMQAMMRELLFEPIAPASVRARELGGKELPEGFDAWFARCVDRDVDRRFANAAEAYAELRSALPGIEPEPLVTARGVSTARSIRPIVSGRLTGSVQAPPVAQVEPKRSGLVGIFAGLAFALVAVVIVAFAAGVVTIRKPDEVAASTAPVEATATQQAPSPPVPSVPVTADERAPVSPIASVHAKPKAPAVPRTAKRGPFDASAAQTSIQSSMVGVKAHCGHRDGPRSVVAQVIFDPETGGVKSSTATNIALMSKPTVSCMLMLAARARVKPFDGLPQTVTAGLGID